jgi:hypothetical protein
MIWRNCVWLSANEAPISALMEAISGILKYIIFRVITIRGASFCHVIRIKLLIQVRCFATFGNHEWVGTRPSFIIMAIIINIFIDLLVAIIIILNINRLDAID